MRQTDLDPIPTEELLADPRCDGAVERREGLSAEAFRREYFEPAKPVIIGGLLDEWRASREWSLEWFREQYADAEVPVGLCFGNKRRMPLGEYIERMAELGEGSGDALVRDAEGTPPLYMEGWYYLESRPELAQDYSVPEHFADDWFRRRCFPFPIDPYPHGILIGPRGAFTKLHYDLWATHSWNAHIVGAKRWVFVPPRHRRDTYPEIRQNAGFYPGSGVGRPDLERYPRMAKVRFLVGEARAGDLVWFPSLWMHEVFSLEDSISITHNYMAPDIYFRVLGRYLAHRFLGMQGI